MDMDRSWIMENCTGSPSSNTSQLRMFVAAVTLVCLACAAKDSGTDVLLATPAAHTNVKDPLAKVPAVFNRLQRVFTKDAFFQKKAASSQQKVIVPKISREMLPHSASTLDWWPQFIFAPMVMIIAWTALRVRFPFRMQQEYLTRLEDVTLADIPFPHLAMAATSGRKNLFAHNSSPDGLQEEPESMDAIKSVEGEIKALATTITGVDKKINAVQRTINALNRKMASLDGAIIAMAQGQEVNMEKESTLYLCVDETGNLNLNKLMQEKERLIEKEKMLMEDKRMLMEDKRMLMEDKRMLMEDKRMLKAGLSAKQKGLKADSTQSVDGSKALSERCKLIEALRRGEYDKQILEDDCLMFTLHDKSIPWLYQDKGEPLLVRRATQEVYTKIKSLENNVLLTGNPGIGKTWFHNYFLLQWIPTMQDDDILALGKKDQGSSIVVVKKGAPAVVMSGEKAIFLLEQKNVTYLVDTGGVQPNEAEFCAGRTILTSSPALRHYKSFLSSRNPVIMYYSPWELNELLAVKPKVKDDLSDEEVVKRFNFVGGIPRHVFANEANYASYLKSMRTAIATGDWSYPLTLGEGNDLELSHRLFIHHARDNYTSFETGFASKAVCAEVFDFLKKKDKVMLGRFMEATRREATLGVMWGQLYETSFFSNLMDLPKDEPFCLKLKRLLPQEGTTKAQERVDCQDLKMNIMNVLVARDVKSVLIEHAGSRDAIAVCPKAKNFATVDGLILDRSCIYGIQVTKQKSHDVDPKGLVTLQECKEILAEKFGEATIILIMVHPDGQEFKLIGDAWKNLAKYPEIKVYEAEWKSPIQDAAITMSGYLHP